MTAGVLQRAVVASFPALLPGAKSVLFKLFKGEELAHPARSPVASRIIADADLSQERRPVSKPATSIPWTISRSCNTPAARPARPRARC